MSGMLMFPSELRLREAFTRTPDFMGPSRVPYAVSLEGALSRSECEEIQKIAPYVIPYSADGCGATTREIPFDPALEPIEQIARNVNEWFFKFDLFDGHHSWLQTYEADGKYQMHMDGMPGQTRKLTAVAILSDPNDYEGGYLKLHSSPQVFVVPPAQGTVVVFQHWVNHEVTPIESGTRQTINMGFWGPPFR